MTTTLSVIIVEKNASLKSYNIKDYKEDELYKKCGFKKIDGFKKQTDWIVKYDGKKYIVSMYGKLEGKANTENKYDFPPPIDTKLFFGNCLLLAKVMDDKNNVVCVSLTIALWDKLYEKLFGGFEDLNTDHMEEYDDLDELDTVPISKKTKKGGYLKDGFVVDSEEDDDFSSSDTEYETDTNEETVFTEQEEVLTIMENIGFELTEEPYEYSEDET